ncbi:mucin-21-like [Drosophila kikkawai]|uniref:Mucin-21-like n=1 Tax=Drosophila kikkawai TaxID=30033 RepID=A0A6P4IIM4_DROKI|nr:cell wall integrity and stress response component 4-like [Drosophila kikkawai]
MQIILAIFLIFASGNLALETTTTLKCQVCLDANDVYCLNQTSYQNCMKGKPFGDVEVCPTGTVCTNDADVCVEKPDGTTIQDVCGDASTCESCTDSNKYTCVSSTQFARCKGTTLVTSAIYSCEEDEVCYQEGLKTYETICVPSCALNYLDAKPSCTNNEFTTTTTTAAPPTTPSDDEEQEICEAAANPSTSSEGATTASTSTADSTSTSDSTSTTASTSTSTTASTSTSTTASPGNKFFYTKNTLDNTCNSYLYCQKGPNDTKWATVFLTCLAPKQYFDSKTLGCVATKPADCS